MAVVAGAGGEGSPISSARPVFTWADSGYELISCTIGHYCIPSIKPGFHVSRRGNSLKNCKCLPISGLPLVGPMPPLVLSDDEVHQPQAFTRSRSVPSSLVQRAQIVVAYSAGETNTVIAIRMSLRATTVGKCHAIGSWPGGPSQWAQAWPCVHQWGPQCGRNDQLGTL